MAAWPGGLPAKPQRSSYSESGKDLVVRTSMKFGADKVRKQFTAATRPMHLKYQMDTATLATFVTFFETTCDGGAVSFTMDHPRTSVSETFRFKGVPTWTYVGGLVGYFVEFDVEEMP